jgi:diguanylate cyclase (GGDEF)-like protein
VGGPATDETGVKSPPRERARRRLSGVAVVLLMLLAGGAATAGVALAQHRGRQRLAEQTMDRYIHRFSVVVTDEVSHYGDALIDLAAGISAQEHLTAADFAGMTAALDSTRLPGATGVAFVVPARDRDTAATQARWRSHGATGLSLYRSGTSIEHQYVIFIRPFTGTALSPGRDLSQMPQASEALATARSSRTVTVGQVHVPPGDLLLPAVRQQIAFDLAAPVFGRPGTPESGRLIGWVTMNVRGGAFLGRTLKDESAGAVQVKLTDPKAGLHGTIAEVSDGTLSHVASLNRSVTIPVGHCTWTLTVRPTTDLLAVGDRRIGKWTPIIGAAFTLLLALLVAVLVTGRNRAMDRVDQATAALRKDIARREEVEKQLHELAYRDQLTGLANRTVFYDRVGQALRTHARSDSTLAVFFIDLDGFKEVNDQLGHSAGDTVLREVADRLRNCLRESDTVARFGGDEFAVIVENLADREDVHITAERIVGAIQSPIDVGRLEATVTASVGIALNRKGDTADDVLREADLAMYAAKTGGKGRHVLAGDQRAQRWSEPAASIAARPASSRATGTRNGEQDT